MPGLSAALTRSPEYAIIGIIYRGAELHRAPAEMVLRQPL